jgi:hypothetical protein
MALLPRAPWSRRVPLRLRGGRAGAAASGAAAWRSRVVPRVLLTGQGGARGGCGALVCSGHIDADYWWPGQGWKQQAACFFGLGAVTFIPGSYVSYIAYGAWRGRPGYTYSQIPVHED